MKPNPLIPVFLAAVVPALAQPPPPAPQGEIPLDCPVPALRFEQAPLDAALRSVSRACRVPILAEPDLKGVVTVDWPAGTLRSVLAALTGPLGLHFEETEMGVLVRRLKTVLYPIDYPQLTRSGSGSASITLSSASNGGNGTGYPNGAATNLNPGISQNGNGSDATQVSISQENQNTFWTGLELSLIHI